jgi:hypothetical protein
MVFSGYTGVVNSEHQEGRFIGFTSANHEKPLIDLTSPLPEYILRSILNPNYMLLYAARVKQLPSQMVAVILQYFREACSPARSLICLVESN